MTEFLIRRFIPHAEDAEDAAVRERYGMLSSAVGVCCNVLLFFIKFLLGSITNSIAIAADAFNNLSDVGSCIVTFVGFKMASKPADQEHPFGHGRIEYISGLVISFFILLVGLEVGKSSIAKILRPQPVLFSVVALVGLCASILVKLWMWHFNRRLAGKIHSAAMEATAADSISDAISTASTMLCVAAAAFTSLPLDGVIGLIVSVMILRAGLGSAKDTLDPLLGQRADPELVHDMEKQLLSYEGILGLHDLIIHDYGPGRRFASVHAEVPADRDIMLSHDVVDTAEREVGNTFHMELVIHMDPIQPENAVTKQMRELTEKTVKEIDPAFTIHDFRMVSGAELTNLIFDICIHGECSMKDREIKEEICRRMKLIDKNYHVVVQVDHAFF